MTYKSEFPPSGTALRDPTRTSSKNITQSSSTSGLGFNPYLGRCRRSDKPIMFGIFGSPNQRRKSLVPQTALKAAAGVKTDENTSEDSEKRIMCVMQKKDSTLGFPDLPPEIRNLVYKFYAESLGESLDMKPREFCPGYDRVEQIACSYPGVNFTRSCRQIYQEFNSFVPRTHVTIWTTSTLNELSVLGDDYEFLAAPMENAYLRSHAKVLRLKLLHAERPGRARCIDQGFSSWVLALPYTFPALGKIQIMAYTEPKEEETGWLKDIALYYRLSPLIKKLPRTIDLEFTEDDPPAGSIVLTKGRMAEIFGRVLELREPLAELDETTFTPLLQTLELYGNIYNTLVRFEKKCIAWTGPLRSDPLPTPFQNLDMKINYRTISSLEHSQLKLSPGAFKNLFQRFSRLQTITLSIHGTFRVAQDSHDGRESVIEMIRLLKDIVRSVPTGVELRLLNTCEVYCKGILGSFDLPTVTQRAVHEHGHTVEWLKERSIYS